MVVRNRVRDQKFIPEKGQQVLTLSSGLQIEGHFKVFKKENGSENIFYYRTSSRTRLLYDGELVPGQDYAWHPNGFSSPLGNLRVIDKAIEDLTPEELDNFGITVGQDIVMEYLSGVIVKGKLKEIVKRNGKNIIFIFVHESAEVTGPDGSILFQKDWGTYDMAIGNEFIRSDVGNS